MQSLFEIQRDYQHDQHEWNEENELEYDQRVGQIWETKCGEEAIQEMLSFLENFKKRNDCSRCYNEIQYWEHHLQPCDQDDDVYYPRSDDFL